MHFEKNNNRFQKGSQLYDVPFNLVVLASYLVISAGCSQAPEMSKKSERGTGSSAHIEKKKKRKKIVTAGDRERAKQHINRANRLRQAGKRKAYVRELEKANEYDPQNLNVEMQLAEYFNMTDDFNRSYKHASQAVNLDPYNVQARLLRARAAFLKASLTDKERFEKEAIADLKKALELEPDNPRVHYCIGIWKSEVGNSEEAIKCYTTAIDLDPNEESYYRFRAMAYTNTKQFDKALADLTRVIETNPASWKTRLARAGLYDQTNELEKALADYTELTKAGPDLYRARYLRADVLDRMKDYKGAISDYSDIIKANNLDDEARKRRADVYMKTGQYKKALQDYDTAIDLNPDIADYYRDRAECYEKLGSNEKASSDEKKAARLKKEKAIEKL